MSDGRLPRGPLHHLMVQEFALARDLDLCAHIYSNGTPQRDRIAAVSRLIARAATNGDQASRRIFTEAGQELAEIVDSIRRRLAYRPGERVNLSYSGGVFQSGDLILEPFRQRLSSCSADYQLISPRYSPAIGAAIHAARLAGMPLDMTVDA